MPSLSAKMKIFFNTSQKLPKKRNWTFPAWRYFTWKPEFVSSIARLIVATRLAEPLRNIMSLTAVGKLAELHTCTVSKLVTPYYLFSWHLGPALHDKSSLIHWKDGVERLRWFQWKLINLMTASGLQPEAKWFSVRLWTKWLLVRVHL